MEMKREKRIRKTCRLQLENTDTSHKKAEGVILGMECIEKKPSNLNEQTNVYDTLRKLSLYSNTWS